MKLLRRTLDELTIEDEASLRHVGLYGELKASLSRDGYRFAVAEPGHRDATWDRVLLLNLTFWGGDTDVLVEPVVPADVVCHVAWHHLIRRALGEAADSADGLFMGEAVASAFDLYLVGRLAGHAPESSFLESQLPRMAEAAEAAGMDADAFAALVDAAAAEPERAFEQLRALLFDAATSLVGVTSVDEAAVRLSALGDRPHAALLHHYELSNWLLSARARCPGRLAPDPTVRALDARLRAAPDSLEALGTVLRN